MLLGLTTKTPYILRFFILKFTSNLKQFEIEWQRLVLIAKVDFFF